ncbi:MAG TPA: nickel pincer cofactor biosynthesis protein LarB [Spirochaetota bacterium]|nr:nickel pincer cofactor biosynthesis protein LarB [Spirochaetota bacterium]HOL58071.1 nickel pincer cofactor biosynthesis protein LarB [Spirochaetota bacterium]HPP03672.1 nickel pincer cofactor biosynthesis protein LarB [Spirochaetota bacterium]
MDKERIKILLECVKENKISVEKAIEELKDLPFKDLDFVKFDTHRRLRRGLPEIVYCKNKTIEQLETICKELKQEKMVIYSRLSSEKANILLNIDKDLIYNKEGRIAYKTDKDITISERKVVILAAGTSDMRVAEEAYCCLIAMGNRVEKYYDVGVAGIHRLFSLYDRIKDANVIIAIAGMEGALPSVVSGLFEAPVIAVPTSIGYGANLRGISPLLTMLNSCSLGIAVVNIDNGVGAAYLATLINQRRF